MTGLRRGPFPVPMIERLLPRILVGDGCWQWTGCVMPNGYGKLTAPKGRSSLAHRLVYEELVGPIPQGLGLDHICHNQDPTCDSGWACPHRRCVNPDHLQPVTQQTNLNRSPAVEARRQQQRNDAEARCGPRLGYGYWNKIKTHCPQGHAYDEANTRWYRGGRRCKACDRDRHNAANRRRVARIGD